MSILFLAALLGACLIGYSFPALAAPLEKFVPWLLVLNMFLIGSAQGMRDLWHSVKNVPAIAVTLTMNFAVSPICSYLLARLLFPHDPVLFSGMMIVGSIPATISSATVWTGLVGGNLALSLVLTIASAATGVAMIPLILNLSLDRTVGIPVARMMRELFLLIPLPVLAAQIARRWLPRLGALQRLSQPLGSALILLLVITALSRSGPLLEASSIPLLVVGVAILNLSSFLASHWLSRLIGCSRPDRISILYASSLKAIAIGLLVGLLYFDGHAVLPVVIYQVFQHLAAYTAAWVLKRQGGAEIPIIETEIARS